MSLQNNTQRQRIGKLAGIIGIAGNVFLCIIKLVAGFVSGSVSIVADALNNLSDAITSVITVVSFRLSGKPADKDHPYGHERIEYVTTLILAFLIVFIGYELVKTSVSRIINPVRMPLGFLTVTILVVSVAGKVIMSRMYRHYAKKIDSPVLYASSKDAINDVYATSAVLIAAVVGAKFNIALDGYAGLAVSAFIVFSGISLIKESVNPILGSSPDKALIDEVAGRIMSYEGVIGIHDLIVHNYGPSKVFASVHAEVDANGDILESHDLVDNIERDISKNMGIELVIHMDPVVINDEGVNNARETVTKIVTDIDAALTIHDFRMVRGSTHTNIIFDVVIPFGFKYKESKLFEIIQSKVWDKIGKEYFCVISFDKDYNGI